MALIMHEETILEAVAMTSLCKSERALCMWGVDHSSRTANDHFTRRLHVLVWKMEKTESNAYF